MTTSEDEAKVVVLNLIGLWLALSLLIEPLRYLSEGSVETSAPADRVDRLEPAGGDEPSSRIRGDAVPRPLLESRREGVLERFLGKIEVPEDTDEGREDTPGLRSIELFDLLVCRLHPGGYGRVGFVQRNLSIRTSSMYSPRTRACFFAVPM